MPKKKIFILIPDGVGLRNFAYTAVYSGLQERGHEVVFWHFTPFDIGAMGYREIKIESAAAHLFTNVLKVMRIRFDLKLNTRRTKDDIYKCYYFKPSFRSIREGVRNLLIEIGVFLMSPDKGIARVRRWIKKKESQTIYFKECLETLKREKPDLVFCTNQRTVYAIAPILAAQSLNIPTATFIFSWDNLPKATMALETDYYLVWSDYMKNELKFYYPYISCEQIIVTGTPQFEPYFYKHLLKDRATFCKEHGLEASRSYICFSGDDRTTSPYDQQYLKDLAIRVRKWNTAKQDTIGIVFRRCPVDFSDRYDGIIEEFKDVITVLAPKWDMVADRWNGILPTPADLGLLVNTIAHTEAVVNLGSSMVFDYASFNKPCVFVAYDGGPLSPCRSVNTIYKYVHFRSMPTKDAVIWVYQPDEFENALQQIFTGAATTIAAANKWFNIVNLHPVDQASSRVIAALEKIIESHETNC